MKTFKNQAAQGDILIRRINKLPQKIIKQTSAQQHIVAHSETGHNHVIDSKYVDFYKAANDDMIMYLEVKEPSNLVHLRSFDTHETIKIDKGLYEVRRQREYTPEGWRRIED